MSSQGDTSQCISRSAADDALEVYIDAANAEVEYGYLQIDHYRSYKRGDVEPKVKRWISLPRGTPVETYGSSYHIFPSKLNKDGSQLSYAFDREPSIESSTSTIASSGDLRQVRFRDGTRPGCEEEHVVDIDTLASMTETKESVADWNFIDRDICGFSLHEYDPESAYDPESVVSGFASSPYAHTFCEELDDAVSLNFFKQQMADLRAETSESDTHEDRQLDKALLLAGVHVSYIHSAPEELQRPFITEIELSI